MTWKKVLIACKRIIRLQAVSLAQANQMRNIKPNVAAPCGVKAYKCIGQGDA